MKQLSVTLVMVVVLATFAQAGKIEEQYKNVIEKCIGIESPTVDDIEALAKRSHDLSKKAKCTIACTMKEIKILTPDGKLDKNVYMKQGEILSKGDAEMMKKGAEVYDVCQAKGDADICEAAYNYAMCIEAEAIARGLPTE